MVNLLDDFYGIYTIIKNLIRNFDLAVTCRFTPYPYMIGIDFECFYLVCRWHVTRISAFIRYTNIRYNGTWRIQW